jgi:VanZ family protein
MLGSSMLRKQRFKLLAWLAFAGVVVLTLGPVSLRQGVSVAPAHIEHFAAYGVLGVLFSLAYPERPMVLAGALILAAAVLEYAQNFVPGRDGRLIDFIFKAAGIVVIILVVRLFQTARMRRFRWG